MFKLINNICLQYSNLVSEYLRMSHMSIEQQIFKDKIKQALACSFITKEHIVLEDILKLHVDYKKLNYNSFQTLPDDQQSTTGFIFRSNQYPPNSTKRINSSVMVTSQWDSKIVNNSYCCYLSNAASLVKNAFFVFVITKVKNEQTGKYNRVLNVVVQDLLGGCKNRPDVIIEHLIKYLQYLRKNCGIKYVRFNSKDIIEIVLDNSAD